MKCINCGTDIAENELYCPDCKSDMEIEAVTEGDIVNGASCHESGSGSGITKLVIALVSAVLIFIIALAGTAIYLFTSGSDDKPGIKAKATATTASNAFLSDNEASIVIDEIMENLENGDYAASEKLLSTLKLKSNSPLAETVSELEEIISLKPRVVNVDTSEYPDVKLEIETANENVTYTKDDFEITHEDSSSVTPSAFKANKNKYQITYPSDEQNGNVTVNDKLNFKAYKNVDFNIPFSFISEELTYADISFITSNVDNYPEISLFFKVCDKNGNVIDNLTKNNFSVKEYLNVNDYLERDVIYAAKVSENASLNVSLALDRSSSISDTDMEKIKNATNSFLSKLNFSSGDKAEIVSFESAVMQMCMFTDNHTNLTNGVNSMYPIGMTALYDALVTSVRNAAAQNGSRCVIAFTDGDDTASSNDVNYVINLATQKSVPIYVIGVGPNTDENELRMIAEKTGGTYHHIDDVSSMDRIYEDIHRELNNFYHVKYVSDSSIPDNSERRIVTSLKGDGYRGECDKTYTPVIPVANTTHNSKYEIIRADITWEDANRECIAKGGHLATITSRDEELEIIALAENDKNTIERLWIGGYTTNDINGNAAGHWVTGETFDYQNWYNENEPSRFDQDNAEEFYLMLWRINGQWSWNDQRNDLVNSKYSKTYKGKMGYVIEYEN